jgi:hypothetical protein
MVRLVARAVHRRRSPAASDPYPTAATCARGRPTQRGAARAMPTADRGLASSGSAVAYSTSSRRRARSRRRFVDAHARRRPGRQRPPGPAPVCSHQASVSTRPPICSDRPGSGGPAARPAANGPRDAPAGGPSRAAVAWWRLGGGLDLAHGGVPGAGGGLGPVGLAVAVVATLALALCAGGSGGGGGGGAKGVRAGNAVQVRERVEYKREGGGVDG